MSKYSSYTHIFRLLLIFTAIATISPAAANEHKSWYLVEVIDSTLDEVVAKRAVLEGRGSGERLWRLNIECDSLSERYQQSPLRAYLDVPITDLWLGARDKAIGLAFKGRVKTDDRLSQKSHFFSFSSLYSVANHSVLWIMENTEQEVWDEFKTQLRGDKLKIWPFFTSSYMTVVTSAKAEVIDLSEYFDQNTEVEFNLGGFVDANKKQYNSDLAIEQVEAFCSERT